MALPQDHARAVQRLGRHAAELAGRKLTAAELEEPHRNIALGSLYLAGLLRLGRRRHQAGGDGDGYSIGGNHFLHACRRNVDLTYIVMDNHVYGMTKGQASPTTGEDWTHSKLTPEGTGVTAIQPVELALACGASFIARGYAGDPNGVARLIAEGICHPGFAVIHILSPCVTYRADQKSWKTLVHAATEAPTSDAREAARRILDDDGFTTGVLLADRRRPFRPTTGRPVPLSEIEKEFRV